MTALQPGLTFGDRGARIAPSISPTAANALKAAARRSGVMQTRIELPEEGLTLPREIRTKLRAFLSEISNTKFFQPDGKPNIEWRLFYGDSIDAAREAAEGAARKVTGRTDVLWDHAWDTMRDAAWDAARSVKRDATCEAISAFIRNRAAEVAKEVACGVAGNAADLIEWSAAMDAALVAYLLTVDDLPFKDKEQHLARARARWEVWQKGYSLAIDVDGVLYVYAKK